MKKILLIDANLLLFRSFYAAQAISKIPGNMPTHLFFNTFFELFKVENPDYVFFAFDGFSKTWRHQKFEQYKAGRIKAPNELYIQKDVIREILNSLNLKHLAKDTDEADDLIATLTEKYKNENEILILSEDRDLLQLIDKNVTIIQKNTNKEVNAKYKKINDKNFFSIYNFYPNQVVDYKGIAGDSSDNLLGIKGIGPKTATNLLSKYKTLEGIYDNINELSQKQKNMFLENKECSFMCKELATLNKNVNLDLNLKSLEVLVANFKSEKAIETLNKYSLKKIIDTINKLH